MRSIIASISEFFLSILSQHRLVPVRAITRVAVSQRRMRRPLSKLFSLLLPALFALTLFAAVPSQAHADEVGKTATGQGAFDCLGEYDWGCRVVSFMFDTENNQLTYMKDGKPVTEQPGPVEGGLRAMMSFFSNAMLIVAGMMLLYHLIVMVAETAHTGTIGGKETNQLWAPIRLVVAIGLLVPLASGMNSGQYIIIQIAKWGSGLASQTWAVFAQALTSNEKLAVPPTPRVYDLGINLLRSYMCMEIINATASAAAPRDVVSITTDTSNPQGSIEKFDNGSGSAVCGSIAHKLPRDTNIDPNDKTDETLSLKLVQQNDATFNAQKSTFQNLAHNLYSNYFAPAKRTETLPNTEIVRSALKDFQNAFSNSIAGMGQDGSWYQKITQEIKTGATTQGWTSAGAWFLAITRAQGSIITGGTTIPEASGPDASQMSANDTYREFDKWLTSSPGLKTTPVVAINPAIGSDNVPNADRESSEFMNFVKVEGENSIDALFRGLDWVASSVDLWDKDPKKAFGDLGSTSNPFGEIAALGQKKIRLGLNYMGVALIGTITSAVAQSLSDASPYQLGSSKKSTQLAYGSYKIGISLLGKAAGALVAVVLMIATLFLLAGVLLAFVVPLLPFSRFFFAILTWLGTLIEAMICMPFFALAFLTPKGEGFSGPNARQGMFLIFQIFIRPVLALFGLIASIMLFYVAAKFLNAFFYEATSGMADYRGDAMIFVQKLVFGLMYAGLIYLVANMTTKMIDHIPKHALRWMGGSASEEGYEGHDQFLGLASAIGGQQLISNFTSLPEKVGNLAGQPIMQAGKMWDDRRSAGISVNRHADMMMSRGYVKQPGSNVQFEAAPTIGSPTDIAQTQMKLTSAQQAQEHMETTIASTQAALTTASPTARPGLLTQLAEQRAALARHQQEELLATNRLQHLKSKA